MQARRKVGMVRVAAIDCGTNSIRVLVADVGGGTVSDVHREMRIVRLGQGVEVGGGSTEVVLGHWDGVRADVTAARSVNIGCVRITERHLRGDPPTADEISAAEQFAAETLQQAFAEVPVEKARTWVGVAG